MTAVWYDVVGGTHGSALAATDYNPDATSVIITNTAATLLVQTSGGTFGTTKHVLETANTNSGQAVVIVDFAGATSVAWAKEIVLQSHYSGVEAYIAQVGVGTTRGLAYAITNTGTMRNRDAANAAKWTGVTTSTEAMSLNTRYHISTFVTQNASTGTYRTVVYNIDTETLLVDTTLRTSINTGASAFTRFQHGIKSSTGNLTAIHEHAGFALDTSATDVILPRYMTSDTVTAGSDQTSVEPWTSVTLTATSSSGSATWSQISGSPTVTLSGGGALTKVFTAPGTMAGTTLGFRATNGTATDDMTVAVLPADVGYWFGGALVPARMRLKGVSL